MVINMPEDFMTLFDEAPLNRRYWLIFALMAAVFVFDFFDFVIVGYLLAAVAPEWHLTYGQSAVILYSGGSAPSLARYCSAHSRTRGVAKSRW
jgi:putative MFS transporter